MESSRYNDPGRAVVVAAVRTAGLDLVADINEWGVKHGAVKSLQQFPTETCKRSHRVQVLQMCWWLRLATSFNLILSAPSVKEACFAPCLERIVSRLFPILVNTEAELLHTKEKCTSSIDPYRMNSRPQRQDVTGVVDSIYTISPTTFDSAGRDRLTTDTLRSSRKVVKLTLGRRPGNLLFEGKRHSPVRLDRPEGLQ